MSEIIPILPIRKEFFLNYGKEKYSVKLSNKRNEDILNIKIMNLENDFSYEYFKNLNYFKSYSSLREIFDELLFRFDFEEKFLNYNEETKDFLLTIKNKITKLEINFNINCLILSENADSELVKYFISSNFDNYLEIDYKSILNSYQRSEDEFEIKKIVNGNEIFYGEVDVNTENKNGRGVLINKKLRKRFIGLFKDNEMFEGTFNYINGDQYEGFFTDEKKKWFWKILLF